MQQTTITAGNPIPFVVKAGEYLKVALDSNSAGTASVPGESIADTLIASNEYFYGKYSTQREVIVRLTSGSATVTVDTGAPPVAAKRNSTGQTVLDDASRGAVISSGIFGRPSFYFFGSSSTDRAYGSGVLSAWGYIGRFLHRCNGGVTFAGSSGISGQDSTAQLDRLPGVIAALPAVKPTHFVLQIAGNDILGVVDLATVKAKILTMVQLVKAAGMIPVLMTTNTLGGLTGAQIIRAAAITDYMRNLCQSDYSIRLADVSRWTGDTTSLTYAPLSGVLVSDNIHLTSYGAWLAGEALYEGVQKDVQNFSLGAAVPGLAYDATNNPGGNLIANPFLNGTAGTGGAWVTAGSVPDGMTLNRTAGTGTVAISKVARTDRPGQWTRLTFAMQAGDVYSIFMRPSDISLGAVSIYGMSETQVDTTSAGSSVKRISLRTRDAAATATYWDGSTPSGTASDHTEPVHASRPEFFRVPTGAFAAYGNGSLSHDLEFKGTGTLIFDIGAMGIYQVLP